MSTADIGRLVESLDQVVPLVRGELLAPAADPVFSLATARELSILTDEALRVLVAAARGRGASWQVIGDALGTTRQAAFQRFGGDADADLVPMHPTLPSAAERAAEHFDAIAAHRWDDVIADFGPAIAKMLNAETLSEAYSTVVGLTGEFRARGEATSRALADVTVVDVQLHHETADLIGRISYDEDGRIVGLWFVPVDEGGVQ